MTIDFLYFELRISCSSRLLDKLRFVLFRSSRRFSLKLVRAFPRLSITSETYFACCWRNIVWFDELSKKVPGIRPALFSIQVPRVKSMIFMRLPVMLDGLWVDFS